MIAAQARERLINLVNRFITNLREQSGMEVTKEFLKATLERRVSEHTEFLVKDFLRNITPVEARDMGGLIEEGVFKFSGGDEVSGKRGRGRAKKEEV